jgi:hypothetical protein
MLPDDNAALDKTGAKLNEPGARNLVPTVVAPMQHLHAGRVPSTPYRSHLLSCVAARIVAAGGIIDADFAETGRRREETILKTSSAKPLAKPDW